MKKQYLAIAVLLFLLLALPLLLILIRQRQEIRPKAAFGTVNLALIPYTLTKNVGEEFEVEVQIIQETAPTPTPVPLPKKDWFKKIEFGETLQGEITLEDHQNPYSSGGHVDGYYLTLPELDNYDNVEVFFRSCPDESYKNCQAFSSFTEISYGLDSSLNALPGQWQFNTRMDFDSVYITEDKTYYILVGTDSADAQGVGPYLISFSFEPGPVTPTPTPTPTPIPITEQPTPTLIPTQTPTPPAVGFICTGPPYYRCELRYCPPWRDEKCYAKKEECQTACEAQQPPTFPPEQAAFSTAASGYLISAADITLTFDKNILEVTNISLPDSQEFTDLLLKEIKNDQGQLRFSVLAKKPTDQLPSGSVIPVAKVTFKGRAPGTSNVTFAQQQIVGYNEQNEDVALGVEVKIEGRFTITQEGLTPTPEPWVPRVNFGIKLRGMSDKKPDLKVRLRVVDEKETQEPRFDFEEIEVTADKDKVYHPKEWVALPGVTPGTDFTLLVKGPKHLQRRMAKRIELFEGEDQRNNFDWKEKPLEPGDLPPQDGVCNAHDASLILERLDKTDEEALKVADLNYDGIVNLNDYSLLLATLSEKYEDEE